MSTIFDWQVTTRVRNCLSGYFRAEAVTQRSITALLGQTLEHWTPQVIHDMPLLEAARMLFANR
jgi:hypothetical protein